MGDGFHPGELAVQRRAGERDVAAHVGRSIRATVPGVAAAFLAECRMLVLGAADEAGRLWASPLFGPPGFLGAPDERTLLSVVRPGPGDPLAGVLGRGGTPVGTIALEPSTRRRMRANGLAAPDGAGLRICVEEAYANCPKYIQRRELSVEYPEAHQPGKVVRASELGRRQRDLIAGADTFFVASADVAGGADASHRGGAPGFVRVSGPDRLAWPDYRGNSMYQTLGNLERSPAAGLLFLDWSTGGVLQLSGEAVIDWSPERAAEFPGARRVVDFRVTDVRETANGSPLRWGAPEMSPANPV
ncbi:pyridoxamine 5'-phosphate oxidase family protein [Streptomyces alkaliterrae]|uniref:Pyridoxamine 5'-phosphate oxidase family protein n=1 Tax=Streptomyces alkaliterrae TaxID=2213162 RepID=A0A5P0YL60_9ACTN|nr:pyridoxamine 5'-phosphate oxidase family protein [Streptomyces alkaliterrae]MBB1257800.1 pyridoxamine 5'-phosphate oxidase family protein [Streptomyces alkaliterrae]MQS01026.1 pyridoxamine 5'-phosphate oxidase family protein [Streptomyces alkaliterrae]